MAKKPEVKTVSKPEFSTETLKLFTDALAASGTMLTKCKELAVNLLAKHATYSDSIAVLGLLAKANASADAKDLAAVRLYTGSCLRLLAVHGKGAEIPARPTDLLKACDKLTVAQKKRVGIRISPKGKVKAKAQRASSGKNASEFQTEFLKRAQTKSGQAIMQKWAGKVGVWIDFKIAEVKASEAKAKAKAETKTGIAMAEYAMQA